MLFRSQSGQFSATLKTSLSIGGVDTSPRGIEHGDYNARVGAGGWTGKVMGVTNPSKINGIAVANISKVNGI